MFLKSSLAPFCPYYPQMFRSNFLNRRLIRSSCLSRRRRAVATAGAAKTIRAIFTAIYFLTVRIRTFALRNVVGGGARRVEKPRQTSKDDIEPSSTASRRKVYSDNEECFAAARHFSANMARELSSPLQKLPRCKCLHNDLLASKERE